MTQPVVLVDGSSWPADGGAWAVVAAVVRNGGAQTLVAVASSKKKEVKDCSVVELLSILAGSRLSREFTRQNPREGIVDVVVVDRPAAFANILAAVEPGQGKAAKMPELASCIEVLLNDLARASIRRRRELRLVIMSRQDTGPIFALHPRPCRGPAGARPGSGSRCLCVFP